MHNWLCQCFTVCIVVILYFVISATMELSTLNLEQLCLKIEEILKCPICLDYLEPPIGQCNRGHGVCKKCQKDLSDCPMCRGQFISFKAIMLTQVVEVLPRICKYRPQGCSVLSFPRDMHIHLCEFRQTICFLCGTMTSAHTLLDHFMTIHQKIYCKDKLSGPIDNFKLTKSTTRLGLFSLFGHLFWRKISADVEKQLFTITFVFVPIGKPTKKYFADIKLKKGSWEYSSLSVIRMRKDMNIDDAIPNIIIPLEEITKLFNVGDVCLSFERLSIEEDVNDN